MIMGFKPTDRVWLDYQYASRSQTDWTDLDLDLFASLMDLTGDQWEEATETVIAYTNPDELLDKYVFMVEDQATFDANYQSLPTPTFQMTDAQEVTYLVYCLSQKVVVNFKPKTRPSAKPRGSLVNLYQMVRTAMCSAYGLVPVDILPVPDGGIEVDALYQPESMDADGTIATGPIKFAVGWLDEWVQSHGYSGFRQVVDFNAIGGRTNSPAQFVQRRTALADVNRTRQLEGRLKLMRLEAMMRDCQWTDDAMAKALTYSIGTLEKMKRKADALNLTPAEVADALAHAASKGLDIHPLTPDGGNQLLVEPEADEPLADEPEPLADEPEPLADEPLAIEPEPLADEPEAIEPEATEPIATEPEADEPEPLADGYVLPTYITQAAEYQALAAEYGEENLNEMDEREIIRLMQSKYSWKQPPADDLADFDFDFPEPEGWKPPVELTPTQKYLADKRCQYMPERTHGITKPNRSVGF